MPEHFQYTPEVGFGSPDAPLSYRIKRVVNLIPIEIEYDENGENKSLMAYIDYSTQEVRFPDSPIEDRNLLKQAVLEYLMRRNQQYAGTIPNEPNPDTLARLEQQKRLKERMKAEREGRRNGS